MRPQFPNFESISARLTVLFGGMFAVALVAIGLVTQAMISTHARNSVKSEFDSTSLVFQQLWETRELSLSDSADVLTRDYGFRTAIASNDLPTIQSSVANLRQRARVDGAFVVLLDGAVVGDGSAMLKQRVGSVPFELEDTRRGAVIYSDNKAYRLVVSPILAPTEIGWMVFVERLDAPAMQALEKLSAIQLKATVLLRTKNGHWRASDVKLPSSDEINALVQQATKGAKSSSANMVIAGKIFITLVVPLPGPSGKPETALLLTYPMDAALAGYRPLKYGSFILGIFGLLLVILCSLRLSEGIARPIAALDKAAQALGAGTQLAVTVSGQDEIARLAQTFNRMSTDIIEREQRISHLAFHDTLTNLPNRANFRLQLESFIGRTKHRALNVALICLDVDDFKIINDSFGHPAGDKLLISLAMILSDLAPDAVVSRLGGDEFAIAIPDIEGSDRPRTLAQQIADRLSRPVLTDGQEIVTSCSIGIALYPADGGDAETLIKNADLALYRAKQDGRGMARFFESDLDAAVRQRRQLELDLRDALHRGEFRLDYQPLWDIAGERYGSCEALMRWVHPGRGLISPVEFIPVAEETGLIVPMGEWAIREACQQAITWPEHMHVAVNVSPLQFRNPGFKNAVFQALATSGLAPHRLELELTESVFADGVKSTVELLHGLRAIGIRIALDDFGTGYSSLSYLRSFPFDKLKIDKSFINNISGNDGDLAIVRAIIDLADALDMETTAEGVEDADQLQCLKELGCKNIQGYFFSKPLKGEDLLAVIKVATAASLAA